MISYTTFSLVHLYLFNIIFIAGATRQHRMADGVDLSNQNKIQ